MPSQLMASAAWWVLQAQEVPQDPKGTLVAATPGPLDTPEDTACFSCSGDDYRLSFEV